MFLLYRHKKMTKSSKRASTDSEKLPASKKAKSVVGETEDEKDKCMYGVVCRNQKGVVYVCEEEEKAHEWAKSKGLKQFFVTKGDDVNEVLLQANKDLSKCDRKLPAVTPTREGDQKRSFSSVTLTMPTRKNSASTVSVGRVNEGGSDLTADIMKTLTGRSTFFEITVFNQTEKEFMVIAIDLIEKLSGQTFWVHKPEIWESIFLGEKKCLDAGQKELSKNLGWLPSFFHNLHAGNRRAEAGGQNDIGTWVTPRTKRNVQQWVLYTVVPKTVTQSDLCALMGDFGTIASDPDIQDLYSQCLCQDTGNHSAQKAVSPTTGPYWKKLLGATTNVQFKEAPALNHVLMDEAINYCVNLIYDTNIHPSMWSKTMKDYAGYN